MVISFGFKENVSNQCMYLKASGSQFIILFLYVDDILLSSTRVELFTKTKFVSISHFDMMDLGDAHVILGIQLFRDRSRDIFGLSQGEYIDLQGLTCILTPHL